MELSEKIKEVRVRARLSQREMAEELKCSQMTISNYESGNRAPSYKMMQLIDALAKKYRVNLKLLSS